MLGGCLAILILVVLFGFIPVMVGVGALLEGARPVILVVGGVLVAVTA